MKVRIVERTAPNGVKTYIIQQKHFLFRWMWTDAWVNALEGSSCQDTFPTLKEAQANLCWFDGTPTVDRVIESKEASNEA